MATFTALNIEPDDHNEVEVDNTKEILVEEALRLYQTALKLHSQGPQYYKQAADAYDALFQSEIFKSAESKTEFERFTEHPELEFDPYATFVDSQGELLAGGDGPSSLPEIFYLAHKNHGQFILDCLKHQQRIADAGLDLVSDARSALDEFSQAIARDESDADLWRKAARVGGVLGSRRIARFCLEAAVELDDDPTVSEVELPALEEAFAGEQLKEVLRALDDRTALSHPIMRAFLTKTLNPILRKSMDPYPFFPPLPSDLAFPKHEKVQEVQQRRAIEVSEKSWASLGDALLQACGSDAATGTPIVLQIPDLDEEDVYDPSQDHMSIEQQLSATLNEAAKEATPGNVEAAADPAAEKTRKNQRQKEDSSDPASTQNSRKRSQSLAGMHESPQEENPAQKRSRRIRNRETLTEPVVDPATQFAEQLKDYVAADESLFTYIGSLLAKLEIKDLGTLDSLKMLLDRKHPSESKRDASLISPTDLAIKDLQAILHSWDDTKASAALTGSGEEVLGSTGGGPNAGLSSFLEHAKSGSAKTSTKPTFPAAENITTFVRMVENEWLSVRDVVYRWLKAIQPSYLSHCWSEQMKESVEKLITLLDSDIFSLASDEVEERSQSGSNELATTQELVEMLFELHLDVHSKITNPNSIVDIATRVKTRDRLNRWALLAADAMRGHDSENESLVHRYLWASSVFATMSEDVSQEHVILVWTEMKALLAEYGDETIELQNNTAMPEVSTVAAEREISRLTTMDFFLSLFQPDQSNPAGVIETLEPVLDPETALPPLEDSTPHEDGEQPANVPSNLKDMWKFLQSGSTSLRLFLWQRLREAYVNIDYPTKEFSCYLRCIEIIVAEIRSPAYTDRPDESRLQTTLLTWMKALGELLIKALTLALNEPTAFEVIEERHLKSTLSSLAQLARMLHSAAIFEDEVRVGMIQLPRSHSTFQLFQTKIREMQIRTWTLLYTVLKEAMTQNKAIFPTADSDLAEYLSIVHNAFGLRKHCKVSNKIFLKVSKLEFIRMKNVEKIEEYLAQVLFDLYGLRLGPGAGEIEDHNCPSDPIDKRTAYNIADIIVPLAKRISMKDLLKSDLKTALEKMQQAIGNPKSTPQMAHNLRTLTEYLRSSIDPQRLYKGLKGLETIGSVPVSATESPLARNEWFYLMGTIALAKFKSQKRLSPGATDDLKVAATFLRLQLQYDPENWEAWYRLGQCFDAELEEDVLWSTDKVNSNHKDITRQQRGAIHCYTMAVSMAIRGADSSFETASKISELYHDFALRVYSSTREPFSMKAFQLDDFKRIYSGDQGLYDKASHQEMPIYLAWRFAASLFKKSQLERPTFWLNHYLYGKCLWKMFSRAHEYNVPTTLIPSAKSVIDAFLRAIETVPKPKDHRSDPILEPHYKILTIMHKMVTRGAVRPQEAADIIQQQPLAIRKGEHVEISDLEEWEPYILECIRHLRGIDKSNWHHRMVSRIAHILFQEESTDIVSATAARQELRDSLLTKTMVVQVWKPEFERAGRHSVYMQRYVLYVVKLLWLLNDKASMELLTKRVRKKQTDYFNFVQVWTECCLTHCRLIRKAYNIPHSHDESFKTTPTDVFETTADRLNAWIEAPDSSHPALDSLRETMELKKLNQSLLKVTPLDDLISDSWSVLYLEVGTKLESEPQPAKEEPQPRVQGPMSLNSLINVDGATDAPPAPQPQPQTLVMQDVATRRIKTIGRREILRRAEAAINKQVDLVRPPGSKPGRGGRRSAASRALEQEEDEDEDENPEEGQAEGDNEAGNEADNEGDGEIEEGEGDGDPEGEVEGEADGDGEHAKQDIHSPSGSVHDSADDESDLSDVPDMDDMDPATIFGDDQFAERKAPRSGFAAFGGHK